MPNTVKTIGTASRTGFMDSQEYERHIALERKHYDSSSFNADLTEKTESGLAYVLDRF
jgi:hypothetical protein